MKIKLPYLLYKIVWFYKHRHWADTRQKYKDFVKDYYEYKRR